MSKAGVRSFLLGPVVAYLSRLRFPRLALVTAVLFAIDLVVPDFIPFADEILLALATLLLTRWKRRNDPPEIESPPPAR
ncbi:DUF6116 family protein [Tahibacter soli]|uniref:Uncharacterized protein n=1 Tax=Tahibacter soli TaxID=2983605 RepID=A0A9X4BHM5_9GAMM|nr:DUF6116 family protein [Tahibacter soli]MDC8013046.1 hypothetical protein [Tahibacter soli]